jgi:NADPH:quinone reductase-like Zn-dependent oxidoreductase
VDTEQLAESGQIGGRTVQIEKDGQVRCHVYPTPDLARLPAVEGGSVLVRTVRSTISPGTEMTFFGRTASNVYLHKTWSEELRLFVKGTPSISYPIVFGYRAAGTVLESDVEDLPVGTRIFGNWRHTEYTRLPAEQARAQRAPDGLSDEDAVDVGQMGPICVNAVAYAEGREKGTPVVVFGAGPVGLITAQVVRANGASEVVVVDRLSSRLAIAERLGLSPLDATRTEDVAVDLKRRFGAEGVAVAFECTGAAAALHEAVRVVRRRGTVVAVGFYQGGADRLMLGDEFHHNGVEIRCGQIGNVHPSLDWPGLRARVVELAASGQLVLGGLPRLSLPVEQVAEGFAALSRPAEVLQVELTYP